MIRLSVKARALVWLTGLLAGGFPVQAWSQDADLTELTLEQLMDIRVTSVSRKEENLFSSAAAVFVITQEDIRRSGVLSIPEALRMVPGLQVAQLSGNQWAISARGFNQRFSNKLLVMIDGRIVYNLIFSGVFWDEQDYVLEDIERIEVIRGPGSTLWGANAVNGVIHIITKKAGDTQGGLVTAGGGTLEQGFLSLRYGGKAGANARYRVYGKFFNRARMDTAKASQPAYDEWRQGRGGFRWDWQRRPEETWTLQGDFYRGQSSRRAMNNVVSTSPLTVRSFNADNPINGANLLARWTRRWNPEAESRIQFYWNREQRGRTPDIEFLNLDTLDLQLQHRQRLGTRHDLIAGFGQHYLIDSFAAANNIIHIPVDRLNYRIDGFLQDEITLMPERLRLILGSKFEINNFSGSQFQPNARLVWTPHPNHTLWTAVSHAVRTPNRSEETLNFKVGVVPGTGGNPATLVELTGNPNQLAEDMTAFEAGYRMRPHPRLFLDLALFYNLYSDLLSVEQGPTLLGTLPGFVTRRLVFANRSFAKAFGAEVAGEWRALDFWTLKAAFTFLELDHDVEFGSTFNANTEGLNPDLQANLRSLLDLPHNLEFDTAVYFVDGLPALAIPRYARVDLRLGWRPTEQVEVSVGILNLQDEAHPEFQDNPGFAFIGNSLVPRSAYGKATWRW